MNILHISAVKNWGGGENHIENLSRELASLNNNSIILCVKNGLFHKRLQKDILQFETAPLGMKMDIRFSFKIIYLCKKYKIDIIHIHDPSALVLTIIADKIKDLPPFVFSKKTSFPIKNRKSTLYKYNYPKIKRILCVSEKTKEIASESVQQKEKLVTIYHGTNLADKSSNTDFLLREKYKIPTSKKVIGVIGNHIRAKNFETLVEVINIIINKKNKSDFHFIQIGNYTDRTESLLSKIKEYNLESNIDFLGYTPQASNFIPQFDALLMTSQSEGIPQVIYESFYHKTPVISTDVGGISEIITHKKNGLLSPKHNPENLAELLLYLFDNSEIIEEFTRISYIKLLEKFTTTIMVKKTLKEYKNILNEK